MYGYISKKAMEKLVIDDRLAYVVCNILTDDVEEYINCMLVSLKEVGFDTKILTKCNIIKTNDAYDIVILVRHNKENEVNLSALATWATKMGNVKSLKDYVREQYTLTTDKDNYKMIAICTCVKPGEPSYLLKLNVKIDSNNNIKLIKTASKRKGIYLALNVEDCNNQIPKIIEKFYGVLYNRDKSTIKNVNMTIDGKRYKYTIIPTPSGIKMQLVK